MPLGPNDYYPAFFGFLGVASSLVFCNFGAAYGTAKAGVGLGGMGIMTPSKVMKNIIPVVMAGVIGIYGLIVSVILLNKVNSPAKGYTPNNGFKDLAAGLCCGLCGLASGMSIGIAGDAGIRCSGRQDRLYVGLILIMIFAEAIALYGLIVALVLSSSS
jgi:V-type H+-transporting ATPase 16kDa proteolipid subunit|eukprot:g1028.t1